MPPIFAPLANWNVRGHSYAELMPTGERHPGADLNVGYGDDDLGLPVVSIHDGTVIARREWDGQTYGFGNLALVEHHLFATDERPAIRLWSAYGHLDSFDAAFVEGAPIAAGQPIGLCGKSGNQRDAHLHFELRYKGPPDMPANYWGGRLTPEAQSVRYADPYTFLRLLEGISPTDDNRLTAWIARCQAAEGHLETIQQDRDYNYRLKMAMEAFIRRLEGRRKLVRSGTADALIADSA